MLKKSLRTSKQNKQTPQMIEIKDNQIGKAKFKSDIPNQLLQKIKITLNKSLQQYKLLQQGFNIFKTNWEIRKTHEFTLLNFMEKAHCQQLTIIRNQNIKNCPLTKKLITSLSSIAFISLKELKIDMNLTSLQFIGSIEAPNLQRISAQFCNLRSIRPLSRANFRNLWQLKIRENYIEEFGTLSRVRFATNGRVSLGLENDDEDNIYEMGFFYKLEFFDQLREISRNINDGDDVSLQSEDIQKSMEQKEEKNEDQKGSMKERGVNTCECHSKFLEFIRSGFLGLGKSKGQSKRISKGQSKARVHIKKEVNEKGTEQDGDQQYVSEQESGSDISEQWEQDEEILRNTLFHLHIDKVRHWISQIPSQ